ncbi:murein L,D-transpeptidase [Hyphomicrobium sp. ghe19]|uniref:L,D-transpeptidase family protein n=1 Tax=Hyphomicrobium sp. ghe19 TaxID=2682968 RepID=UPI00136737CB|nr:hypothetical protein HYPP_02049 [Hyphomicrobium sp. ghe19]
MTMSLRPPHRPAHKGKIFALSIIGAVLQPSLTRAQDAPVTPPQAPVVESPIVETPGVESSEPPEPLMGTAAVICAKLAAKPAAPFEENDSAAVSTFYQARQCRPLWVDEQGPTRAATLVMAELGRAEDWGLKASDFELAAVKEPTLSGSWTPEQTAQAELEISAAALRYAHEAEGSRISEPEKRLSGYLDRAPVITDATSVLTRLAAAQNPDEALRAFQPSQDQFLKLKALLARLRGHTPATEADRFDIPRRGAMLQAGVRDADVATLKQRFGIASAPGSEQLYDDQLAAAVKKFQASKSLHADGIVGASTRAKLSGEDFVTTPEKIAAVVANMEEWRWMPRSLGATHVFVNIPAFSIVLTDNNKPVFEERVVVGTPSTQTPVFSKDMTKIVLRPRWNLPDSIKMTALRTGRSIERQGYVVMHNGHVIDSSRVNWSKAKLSNYMIYQPSGDDNALGLVKLLFPNKHSVYLHDTPSRHLFNERVRLFSHGCMRVRNPQQFAQLVFNIDRGHSSPNVGQLVNKGPMDNQIALNTPIPVHVGYFTAWVANDGTPQFFDDYYGHQKRITLALAGKWKDIDVTQEHVTPETLETSAVKKVHYRSARRDEDDDGDRRRHGGGYDRRGGYGSYGGDMGWMRSGRGYSYGNTVGDVIRRALGF